jgi:magnesium chelatase family protein
MKMLAKINTATIRGIEAVQVTMETDLSRGLPAVNVVGLADTTIKEAKERIRAAILNSGCEFPAGRITINMAPADVRKKGSHLDLPMAMGILLCSRQLLGADMDDYCFMGELSLDGSVNKITGVLPMVNAMAKNGARKFIVPFENREEAALVRGVEIYPAAALSEIIDHFNMRKQIRAMENTVAAQGLGTGERSRLDFADVKGQEYAKRAITVAVAGGHGIIMTGSPSTGKTMLAERIPTIMPAMTYEEILEASIIYSVAGLLDEERPYISERPFRRPHHKITAAGLIGGGAYPRPGEITLASGGVLFTKRIKNDNISRMAGCR